MANRYIERPWMRRVLAAAAVYNLAWGAIAIASPGTMFGWMGIVPPNYPALWQCIGMLVGVYGLGYGIASRAPFRHWAIVAVGLAGKVLGPVGLAWAAWRGELPWRFGWINLANDLIWWVPFGMILLAAYRSWAEEEPISDAGTIALVLEQSRTQRGESLADISQGSTVMTVFLRHAGCTFCREALGDLARSRGRLEENGTRLVLVHMSPDADAARFFGHYGLGDVDRISDPERRLYRVFGLRRGDLAQLFGWKVWWRGVQAGVLDGHGLGRMEGDGFQMPGVFVLAQGEVGRSFRHRSAADRPNYEALAECGYSPGKTSRETCA